MNLNNISSLKENSINRVYVSVDKESENWYTVWEIKNRRTARTLMEMQTAASFAECAMEGENACMILPYEEPRPLSRFYNRDMLTGEERKQVYKNIITACVTTKMPCPLLYLLLKSNCLNIRKNNSVFFTYYVLLDEFDKDKGEEYCVRQCARMIAGLMEPGQKDEKECLKLIQKKLKRNSYQSFTELYQDLKLIHPHKNNLGPDQQTKDKLFKVFLIVTIIIVVLAIVLFTSQAVLGDVPILRMFHNSFQKIGEGLSNGR